MVKVKKECKISFIFKGLVAAMLFTILALSLFSIVLVKTNLSEDTIEPVILIVLGVSILFGSSIGVRKSH